MTARSTATEETARDGEGPEGEAAAPGAPGGRAAAGPMVGKRPPLRRTFVAFNYPGYRLLWLSMAVAMTGMQMQMIARGLLAYELSPSFKAVGFLAAAWGIPQFFLALPGGAIADRMDKRRILLLTQAAVFAQALAIGLLISFDAISIELLFLFGVLLGGTFSFNMPARQAFVPELVPRHQLMNAIALNNTAMNSTRLFSPVAAGLFIAAWGFATTYYITAAMYALAWLAVLLLPRSTGHLEGAASRGGMFQEIGLGLRYVRANQALKMLMVMAFVPLVVGMPFFTILPAFVSGDLELGSLGFGLLVALSAVGALFGSLIVATLNPSGRLARTQAALGAGWGAGLIVLGLGSLAFGVAGAAVAMIVIGICSMAYLALNNGMIMTSSSPQYHGRVMSLYMLTFGVFPLMGLPLGILGDTIGGYATFALLGVGLLAFVALAALFVPSEMIDRAAAVGPGEGEVA